MIVLLHDKDLSDTFDSCQRLVVTNADRVTYFRSFNLKWF